MDKDLALYIIEQAYKIGVPALKFNWRGESTLHQNFTEILKRVKTDYFFYDVIVNTNGNVPDDALEGLRYTTKVVISLDAFGKDLYASLRKKGDIRTVINTINYLIDSGHNNIWVRRIKTKANENEDYFAIAKNIFGDKVKVSEHYCFDRNLAESYQVKEHSKTRRYCAYPSQRLVISTEGNIYPCCVDYFETMPLGNILDDDLQSIWRSYQLTKLRVALKYNNIGNMTEQCKNCTSFMAYNTPEREAVTDTQCQLKKE